MNSMIGDLISLIYTSRLEEDETAVIPRVLNYSISSFKSNEMVLNANFSEPLLVSSSIVMDFIDLIFHENWLFRAKSDGFMLETNYTLLGIEVPR